MPAVRRLVDAAIRNIASRPTSELVSIGVAMVGARAKSLLGALGRPRAIRAAARHRERSDRNARLVIFASHVPRSREAKLASALQASGWHVVLLYAQEPAFDIRPYFHHVRRYTHVWDALSIACEYPARAYHVFETSANWLAEAFIAHKPGPIVLDVYDVVEGFRYPSPERLQQQRFCVENADALCSRDLKPKHLQRNHGYRLPTHLLFFPDYCWGAGATAPVRPAREAGELHVVNAGTFGIEKRGFGDTGFLDIARSLAKQKIHFHIYPHSTAVRHKQHESDYVALAKETPYLHLHPSMPTDALIPELARYDAGVFLTKFLTFGEDSQLFDRQTLLYQGSARTADYLDAGLAVICNKEMRFAFFMAGRYGVAIDGSIAVLREARSHLSPAMSPANRAKLSRASSAFSVHRHGRRLGAFYERIGSSQPVSPSAKDTARAEVSSV